MTEKNVLLPNLDQAVLTNAFVHILGHRSVAVRRFAGRYKNQANHYAGQIGLRYNQWQENLSKYKAPQGGQMMTHADLSPGGTSEEQMIPFTHHGCASQMISYNVMKRAMGSRETMAEFIADMVELAISRGAWEIDQKFMKDICNLENYKDGNTPEKSTSIFLHPESFYKPDKDTDETPKVRKIINSVDATGSAACWPSAEFNKYGLTSVSFGTKSLGVIISSEMKSNLKDYYGHVFNVEFARLEEEFGWVETMPIHKYGAHIVLIGEDGYVLEIDEDGENQGWDESRKIFREKWFYWWIDAYQAVAHGVNRVIWAVDPKSSSAKDLEMHYKEISSSMTKKEAESWKKEGFNFNQTKEWIDIGLKNSDAKFAKWLKDTKGGDYAKPDWLLSNAGKDSVKSIDDLRKEAGV